jgi:type II secretory pathway component GspD/PulD (secretin)
VRTAIVISILLATAASAAEPQPAPAAEDAYTPRVKALEAEIRTLVDEQAKAAGPAGAAFGADYAAAKARASEEVRRRLQFVEYYLSSNDYTRAVDACNSILIEYPHEPATVRLKYRILTAMVERERAIMDRERSYRAEESLADAQARGIIPKEGPKIARTFMVFDEDVEEIDRAAVKQKLQERVTLNYDGVEVGEVLKPLFAIAGINYVILDRALSTETLTLHLVDDTVENALKTIAKLVEVHYNYSANTVFIGAADSEVMVSEIIRLSSGLTDVTTELQVMEPAAGGDGSGGGQPPQQQPQQGPNGTAASTDLERFLEKVPDIVSGWPTEGKMYLDRKSNTLYVRATPAALTELKRLLRALDYHSAQVLIEARFVEVREGAEKNLGVDWGFAGSNGSFTLGGPMGGGVQTPAAGLTFDNLTTPISAATAGGSGLSLGMLFSPSNQLGIKAAIQALESENQAEQLAEPRILTLNNSIGNIRLTQSVSFIKSYTYSNTASENVTDQNGNVTNVSNSNPQPEWGKDYEGITLRIRPSIARNSDIITLEVQPTVRVLLNRNTTTIRAQTGTGAASQQNLNVENPDFRTRTLATTLHIRNGQTVVLGGLTQDNSANGDSGIPGMRTVPFLGRLFSSKSSKMDRSNLLIFVTAYIIDPSGAKIGEDIIRLRDTAAVVLPDEARQAEAEMRVVEAQRAADAQAASKAADEQKPVAPTGRTGSRR